MSLVWVQHSGSYPLKSKDLRYQIADYGNRIVAWHTVVVNAPRKIGEFETLEAARLACEADDLKAAA